MASIELRIPPVPASVPAARHTLGVWLDGLSVDPARKADVLMVISELVTNGVIHDGGDDISLRATGGRTGVTIEVVTADRPPAAGSYDRQITHPDQSGRGLAIAAGLSDDISVLRGDGRVQVRCRLTIR